MSAFNSGKLYIRDIYDNMTVIINEKPEKFCGCDEIGCNECREWSKYQKSYENMWKSCKQADQQHMKHLYMKNKKLKEELGIFENKEHKRLYEENKELTKKINSEYLTTIMISINDEYPILKVKEELPKLNNWLNSKCDKWEYVIEQRSENENYSGFHIHIIMYEFRLRPSKIAEGLWRDKHVKSWCREKNFIEAKSIKANTKHGENAINYLTGNKEKKKLKKVDYDNKMREHFGFLNIYKSN